jgi:hypothetical protein
MKKICMKLISVLTVYLHSIYSVSSQVVEKILFDEMEIKVLGINKILRGTTIFQVLVLRGVKVANFTLLKYSF